MDPEQAGCVLAVLLGLAHMLGVSQSAAGLGAGFAEVLIMGERRMQKDSDGKNCWGHFGLQISSLGCEPWCARGAGWEVLGWVLGPGCAAMLLSRWVGKGVR